MIFLKLFIVFTKIGTFNFGGGYAMLSLIHNEVVVKNAWLSNAEFTDIVAISQSTPGPIGINAATYAGYVAVLNQGYPEWLAAVGSVIASLSIIWLPFVIMILISRYLINHKDSKIVKDIFKGLRPTIVGLIAAAAVLLMNKENFGSPTDNAVTHTQQNYAVIDGKVYTSQKIINEQVDDALQTVSVEDDDPFSALDLMQ